MITRGFRWRTGGYLKSSLIVFLNLTPPISHAEDLINEFWAQHPEQRPKPKGSKQATTAKGGKGKLPLLEIVPSSKSKSRSRYDVIEDVMEVDEQPPKKKPRLTKASKPVSSSSAGAHSNGKSFSKLEQQATESADERGRVQNSSGSQSKKIQRLDLGNTSDLKTKVQAVETVEMSNGKLFYFVTL
jgi:hypothetical protein